MPPAAQGQASGASAQNGKEKIRAPMIQDALEILGRLSK
jgi:hypothetical protein